MKEITDRKTLRIYYNKTYLKFKQSRVILVQQIHKAIQKLKIKYSNLNS